MTAGARAIAAIMPNYWPLRRVGSYWASPGIATGSAIGIDHVSMLQAEQLGIVTLDDARAEARLVNPAERKPLYTPEVVALPDAKLPDGRPVPPPELRP